MAKKKTSGKFPLFLHSSGQWAKKIRGRTRYFGTIKDEALKEYVRVREDLEAGRVTRPRSDQAISMADLCNSFLTSKRQRVDSGELSGRIWSEYHKACEMIVDQFGRDRQSDCSNLQRETLAVKPGWLNAPRQKTGVARRCPLWPETTAALEEASAVRPNPKDPADFDCVFITKQGFRWVKFRDRGKDRRGTQNDSASQEFKKLLKKCVLKLTGGFYIFRHTFRTVADALNDRVAIDTIMGHADDSMGATYREPVADERLERVTNHVRQWLLRGRTA